MKIAICDDEQVTLDNLNRYISDFFKNRDFNTEIYLYTDGNSLLANCRKINFDILFLDIEMPGISGMETADLIRDENAYIHIIFVTNKEDLVYQSLKYAPFRFIRKSYFESELEEALISLTKKIESKNVFYEFTTEKGDISLNIVDIIYIEVFNHNLIVHSKEGSINAKGSLNKLEKEFKGKGFIRIHKCYLVNYRYIYSINTKDVILDDKRSLPLSRYKINETKLKFQVFTRSM